MNLAIQKTKDGSNTLCDLDLNQTYRSRHGAFIESQHVFIQSGLEVALQNKTCLHLLEVGLGTGLNALLTIRKMLERQAAQQPCEIYYTALEPYPVPVDVAKQLDYAQRLENPALFQELFAQLHDAAWGKAQTIAESFHLTKVQSTLADFESFDTRYHLVYFDPFSRAIHPDLWDIKALAKIESMLDAEGILITYAAQSQFKHDLRGLGLEIQRLRGPGGKREMTRAVKHVPTGD